MRIQLLVKINAKWFREFLAFNPQPYLQKATIPLLAINGDQDVQADPEDINRMREFLTDDFDGRVIPGVNHILRKGGASPATYKKQLTNPLDDRVLQGARDWIVKKAANNTAIKSQNTVNTLD